MRKHEKQENMKTKKSQFCCHHLQRLTLCSPLLVRDVFGYCLSLSARDKGRAGFGICGPGITIDESVAVPAAALEDEDLGNGS